MSLIRVPVPGSNKEIEQVNLEAHVAIGEERHRLLDDRIRRAEIEIDNLHEQQSNAKKVLIGGLFSIIAGLLVGAFTIATNYLPKS
jgi:hypothetical protein